MIFFWQVLSWNMWILNKHSWFNSTYLPFIYNSQSSSAQSNEATFVTRAMWLIEFFVLSHWAKVWEWKLSSYTTNPENSSGVNRRLVCPRIAVLNATSGLLCVLWNLETCLWWSKQSSVFLATSVAMVSKWSTGQRSHCMWSGAYKG